ncbi:MAG: pectate lyase [Bacteroidetes bacterium]|nr:pectate lyase [Bacteroidota bacterium]
MSYLKNIERGILVEILAFSLFFSFQFLYAQTKAFPSAEGYGQFTTGGRGGEVFEVTNLNDSGIGSLRYAAESSGKRTIIFRISGNIELKSILRIKNGDLTIAGQTAPGDGICIQGYPVRIDADNIIIRYIRFRLGDINNVEDDAIWGRERKNIIIDHCSMSWSTDEAASFYDNENFTMQWCIISESLFRSVHAKGDHGYGGIWGGWGATFHHNLLAHHTSRNPRFNGSRYLHQPEKEIVDFVNNVIYNWGDNSIYGGEEGNYNIRANYFKSGPATQSSKKNRIVEPWSSTTNGIFKNFGKFYVEGNFIFGFPETTADNISTGVQGVSIEVKDTIIVNEPFPVSQLEAQTAENAFELVLENAGANFPRRDSVDLRIIEETETGTAAYGNSYYGGGNGIIDSQNDVGGWPFLNSLPAPADTDHDGMPDGWEQQKGLDLNNPDDRNLLNPDGYTMLEVYLEDLLNGNVTSIKSENNLPSDFVLYQNYPNPFNPNTTISFNIPEMENSNHSNVVLKIYDIISSEVTILLNKKLSSGHHSIVFEGKNLSSGLYFYELSFMNFRKVGKMVLLK